MVIHFKEVLYQVYGPLPLHVLRQTQLPTSVGQEMTSGYTALAVGEDSVLLTDKRWYTR